MCECLVCNRIQLIKDGKNPYFVKELETGYVVLGDIQRFKGYTLFLCKEHATELHFLELRAIHQSLDQYGNFKSLNCILNNIVQMSMN